MTGWPTGDSTAAASSNGSSACTTAQGRFGGGDDWPPVGRNPVRRSPNTNGNPEFVMRLVANLLDPEPGYYNASTYYGEKNIAAIGFSLTDQHDAVDGPGTSHVGNFFGWNFDFLLENKMTAYGSGTFEAAYYHYAVGGRRRQRTTTGDAYLLFAGWLLPQECRLLRLLRPVPSVRPLSEVRS